MYNITLNPLKILKLEIKNKLNIAKISLRNT